MVSPVRILSAKNERDEMTLEISVSKQDTTCYIEPVGFLDTETYKMLEDKVNKMFDGDIKVMIINMSGVEYISSLGLGALIKAKKKIEEKNGMFMLTSLQPQIKRVIEVVKTLPGLNVFKSVEEADAYLDKIQEEERT